MYYRNNLQLPLLPPKFEKALVKIQHSHVQSDTHYFSGTGEFKYKQIPEVLYKWVNDNICADYLKLGVQSIENGDFDPHIDGRSPGDDCERQYSLLYVIDTGGNDSLGDPWTRFYKTQSESVEPTFNVRNNKLYNRKDLTLVAECQFKKHTWNLINNQTIHSVDNITSTRICLALGFYCERPDSLVKMGLI